MNNPCQIKQAKEKDELLVMDRYYCNKPRDISISSSQQECWRDFRKQAGYATITVFTKWGLMVAACCP